MRLFTIGFLATLSLSACSRDPAAAASALSADPAVATAGTKEAAARDAAPSPAATRAVTLPAGTRLPIVLDEAVGSDISRVEQPVQAHLSRAILVGGHPVLAQGSRVNGVVTDATRSAKVKGRAHIGMRFHTLIPRGHDERYAIRTAAIGRVAPGTKKKDALEIGLPAAGGAAIGALIGGKKGALVGTAAGGGAGAAVVLATRGKEVRLPKGAPLTLRLSEPLTIRVGDWQATERRSLK